MALTLSFASGAARAAQCPVPTGFDARLGDIEGEARLRYLRDGLDGAARRARIWTWSWMAGYAALSVGQLALLPAFPEEERPERWVGAGAAAIGLLVLAVTPLRVMGDARTLERRLAAATGDDPCALLADAERFLVRDAEMENRVNKWWSRAGTLAFNAGCVVLLVFAFQRYEGAAINFAGGAAIGQIMLNTQPTESLSLLRRYRAGRLDRAARPAFDWSVSPMIGSDRAGAFGLLGRLAF